MNNILPGLSLDQLAEVEDPDPWFIMRPWLPEKTLGMIHAYRGGCKTFCALQLAYCAAFNKPFLCWRPDLPFKVGYADGEMGRAAIKGRLLKIDPLLFSDTLHEDRGWHPQLHVLTFEDCPGGVIWNLADPAQQVLYDRVFADCGLIIIDNIATCVRPGPRESEVEAWARVQTWAIRQRESGKAILFIHHSGKNLQQRGSSTKEDALDVVINLRKPPFGGKVEGGTGLEWHFEKTRHFWGADTDPLWVEMLNYDDSISWRYCPLGKKTAQRAIELKSAGWNLTDISRALNFPVGVIKAWINEGWQYAKDGINSSGSATVEIDQVEAGDDEYF